LAHTHFLLQRYSVRELAENTVMHVLVNDVHASWQHIALLDWLVSSAFHRRWRPRPEPWGLTVA
jgi:hypothetical protein